MCIIRPVNRNNWFLIQEKQSMMVRNFLAISNTFSYLDEFIDSMRKLHKSNLPI